MNRLRVLWLPLLAVATAGCLQYRAGSCDKNYMHCGDGFRCDTSINRCVENTGGTGGGAGGAGGTGGMAGAHDAGMDLPMDKGPPPCTANSCSGDTPICDDVMHACRACGIKSSDCHDLDPTKPVCRPTGDAGRPAACVECTQDSHCTDSTKPVCDQSHNVCVGCAKDDDCQRFSPGVCKTPPASSADAGAPKGRCVGEDETIYVNMVTGCSATPTTSATDAGGGAGGQGGSSGRPFCSMEPIRNILSGTRNVVVVSGQVNGASWSYNNEAGGPILLVGKSATIVGAASPAFQMSNGDVTIRSVTFKTGTGIGIEADGGMLRLDHVTVRNCAGGGIWLSGANFDIQSSTIASNGPGTYVGFNWGGILETKVPGTGLKNISQVTVNNNTGQGITCADQLTGGEVLAYSNSGTIQISTGCGLTLCSEAGMMCGAQP